MYRVFYSWKKGKFIFSTLFNDKNREKKMTKVNNKKKRFYRMRYSRFS